jgi:2-polyprenyl-3-methyl-5-hydroxy-6-metoxy-1,4-benzoquinol methylase
MMTGSLFHPRTPLLSYMAGNFYADDGYFTELFTNKSYKEQEVKMPSGRSIKFNALISSSTDCDLTGQIIWPGCSLLLTWIDRHLDFFNGKSITEVGAGIAICSLFLTKFGKPKMVTATDGNEIVVDLMKDNAELVGCQNIVFKEMMWGAENAKRFREAYGQFDVVMGSEIAYNENCIDPLVETMSELLAPNGRFIIGHIFRYGRVTRYLFQRLEEKGFEVIQEIRWDDLMSYRVDAIEGSVFIIKRKSEQ